MMRKEGMTNKNKIKLPDFSKDPTWIELKKKMGIEEKTTNQKEKVTNDTLQEK